MPTYFKLFKGLGHLTGGGGSTVNRVNTAHFRKCFRTMLDNVKNSSSQFVFGQNANSKLQTLILNMSEKVNLMALVLTQQCNRVAALRMRRAYQILLLYQRIYGEQVLMQKIKSNIQLKARPFLFMLSATIFQWENQRVTEEELQKCREEIEEVHQLVELSHKPKLEVESCTDHSLSTWEQIIDRPDFKVWRRLVPDSQLYQYRVFGHFTDIPARAFYNTQVDLDYWKDWDKNTIEAKIIETDGETGSDVVHWTYKYPYPMHPRDYVYVRRSKTDPTTNTMVITARATDHPSCPVVDPCVRVATYCSTMVIQPYTTFDENGFNYVMTYLDDPQTNFPTVCYNWMASTGVHEFLERVHKAARKKHERSASARIESNASGLYAKMAHH